jgi:hypothetical protein
MQVDRSTDEAVSREIRDKAILEREEALRSRENYAAEIRRQEEARAAKYREESFAAEIRQEETRKMRRQEDIRAAEDRPRRGDADLGRNIDLTA